MADMDIIRADRQLRKELESIEDEKLRAECLRAFEMLELADEIKREMSIDRDSGRA